jgi:transglutaminase-like putative cysteine protease
MCAGMTTLRIEHLTSYFYSQPVAFGRHRLVLRPREGHDIRILDMQLEIAPAHRLLWSRDVFGNSVALVDFIEQADKLEIRSEVVIQRMPPFSTENPRARWHAPYPVVYDPLEAIVTAAYQALSYPDDVEELHSWLDGGLKISGSTDAEEAVIALGTLIHGQIRYLRRTEKGVQTPAETLRLGTGSCRDVATLMMEAARMLGIASRFVSGYLHCMASDAGIASTHAWTEVYLPSLGWRGFDPTIGEPTSVKHVVTGVSNHPRGVMPVSGMFTGSASHYRRLVVQVKTEELVVNGMEVERPGAV